MVSWPTPSTLSSPLIGVWRSWPRAFYGQDKDDVIDGRTIAVVVLRRRHQLPLANDFGQLARAIREAERAVEDLSKRRTELVNRLHLQLSDVCTSVYENVFRQAQIADRPALLPLFPAPARKLG